MGTRNLTAVMVDGEYKIAQYGQWDGYPEGQGKTALTFLRDGMQKGIFLDCVKRSRYVSGDELERLWKKAHQNENSVEWKAFTRDTGAEILELMQKHGPLTLRDSISFAGDSIFCEYAYVADFDKGTFEVFKGFNKTPLDPSERFSDIPPNTLDKPSDGEYFQVKLIASFPLDALPTDEDFLNTFRAEEEEDEKQESAQS